MDTKNKLPLIPVGIQVVIWGAPGGCFFGSNNLLPDGLPRPPSYFVDAHAQWDHSLRF